MNIINKIKCYFKGHSHPWFTCVYCGRKSSLGFARDKYGYLIRDSKGNPIIKNI